MATQMPAGFTPIGHHGGGRNAAGAYWYPTRAHAREHAEHADLRARGLERFLAEPNHGPDLAGELPAMKSKAAALRQEATDAEKHADSLPDTTLAQDHADFDDHVDGPLKSATERYVSAAKAHAAAAAAKERAHEAADDELQTAGEALEEAQGEANTLAPYSDMEQDGTHSEYGSASGDDDHHLGAEHPDVHAAHAFLATAQGYAEPHPDDDAEGVAAFRAHVHGPLKAATEAYKAARGKHAATLAAVKSHAEAAKKAHDEAADHLHAQQQIASRLAWGFPDEIGADDMADHGHGGASEWADEPDEDDIANAPKFLATAQKVKAKAHELTRGAGIDMDTLVHGADEDEDDEAPMSKAMRGMRTEWRALRALLKGVKKGTKKKDNPEWEKVGRTYRKRRGESETHRVISRIRGKSTVVQTLAKKGDYAAHEDGLGFHVTHVSSRKHIATVDTLSAARQLMGHIRLHGPEHEHVGREAEWAGKWAGHRTQQRQHREGLVQRARERREAQRAADRASAKERKERAAAVGRSPHPPGAHPEQPTTRPAVGGLSPHASALLDLMVMNHDHAAHGGEKTHAWHEDAVRGALAQEVNQAIGRDAMEPILRELGGHVKRRITKTGQPKVSLRDRARLPHPNKFEGR